MLLVTIIDNTDGHLDPYMSDNDSDDDDESTEDDCNEHLFFICSFVIFNILCFVCKTI